MPLQLLVLALDAALYPTLLAAVVILLSQPRRKPLLSAYLAGGLTISIGLGLGIIAALKGSSAVDSSTSAVSWTTDLAVGGLALLLAVALATRADARFQERRRAKKPDKHLRPRRDRGARPSRQRMVLRQRAQDRPRPLRGVGLLSDHSRHRGRLIHPDRRMRGDPLGERVGVARRRASTRRASR
jgi:hypothetical protein